jgi:integrase
VDNRRLTGKFIPCKTETEALEVAGRLAGRIETGETKAASLTEKQAMEFILCSDALQPFHLTVTDATSWMTQALPKAGDIHKLNEALNFYSTHHRKLTPITVADMVTKLLERKQTKSERHQQTMRSILNRFAKAFVGKQMSEVTTPQIQTYLDKCDFESEQTYHNHRTLINQLFRYAFRMDYVLQNHCDKVDKAELEDGDVGIYTPEEIVKLLNAAATSHPEFLPCMVIGAFAGLRSAEIERVTWEHIHWQDKEFFLDKRVTKTKYPRSVPMHDNLIAWLTPYKDCKGKIWKGLHDAYYDTQTEVAQTAGVEWVRNGLRHSYGSYRCRAFSGDVTKVSAEMGNSKAMVENHYKRLVKEHAATAWFAVKPEQAENIVSLAATA